MSTNINLTGNSRIKLIQETNSRRKKSQSREWRPLPYHIKLTKVRLFKTHYFSWPSFSLFCPGQGTIKVTGTFCAKKAILIFFFLNETVYVVERWLSCLNIHLIKHRVQAERSVWLPFQKGMPCLPTNPSRHLSWRTDLPQWSHCLLVGIWFLYKTLVVSHKTFISQISPFGAYGFWFFGFLFVGFLFFNLLKSSLSSPGPWHCPFYGQRCNDIQKASQHDLENFSSSLSYISLEN